MQYRIGPNRVGPWGLLQPLADGVKFIFKEELVPDGGNPWIFRLAPVLAAMPSMLAIAVIPFGDEVTLFGVTTSLSVTDLDIGILYVLALGGLSVYGVILGGWASNSKYALLGGLRSAAQLISYEVPMGFAVVSAVLMSRSLSLVEIVERQKEAHLWFVFPGLIAFFLYFVSGVAETNRIPFDLPEAESELVAGFHTEYSGFRWAIFFLSEYANMVTISAVATVLFFGGWLRPFPNVGWLSFLDLVPPLVWFVLKVSGFLFVYMWFRGTFPRYRFDQLMALGWKWLIPLSIVNVLLVAVAALWKTPGLKVLSILLWGFFGAAFFLALRAQTKPAATPAAAGVR
jgi:NADH-quinone oxidoreductase subunit H